MYVCMYVCMHVCMYVCMHACYHGNHMKKVFKNGSLDIMYSIYSMDVGSCTMYMDQCDYKEMESIPPSLHMYM